MHIWKKALLGGGEGGRMKMKGGGVFVLIFKLCTFLEGSHMWDSIYCKRGKSCVIRQSCVRPGQGNQVVLVLCFNIGYSVFLGLTVPVYYRHSWVISWCYTAHYLCLNN